MRQDDLNLVSLLYLDAHSDRVYRRLDEDLFVGIARHFEGDQECFWCFTEQGEKGYGRELRAQAGCRVCIEFPSASYCICILSLVSNLSSPCLYLWPVVPFYDLDGEGEQGDRGGMRVRIDVQHAGSEEGKDSDVGRKGCTYRRWEVLYRQCSCQCRSHSCEVGPEG